MSNRRQRCLIKIKNCGTMVRSHLATYVHSRSGDCMVCRCHLTVWSTSRGGPFCGLCGHCMVGLRTCTGAHTRERAEHTHTHKQTHTHACARARGHTHTHAADKCWLFANSQRHKPHITVERRVLRVSKSATLFNLRACAYIYAWMQPRQLPQS